MKFKDLLPMTKELRQMMGTSAPGTAADKEAAENEA